MRLTHRIFLLVLVTISLSTLANFLLTRYQQEALHNDSEKILAHTIVQSMRDALVQDVINGNKLRVSNLLKSLQKHDNPVEFLYVIDREQTVFAHSFEQGFPRYLLQARDQFLDQTGIRLIHKYKTEQGVIYEYSEPLILGLGMALHLGINQTEIAEKLAQNNRYILLTSIAITLLALLVAYFWSKQITTPLTTFAHQIQRFAAGETVDLAGLGKADPDIRHLAEAFQAASDERYQAHTALLERERDLSITLDSIADAVIATDAKGNITRMNPVAELLTGWSLGEAKGQSVRSILPIIDATTRKSIENPIERVLTSGDVIYLSNHTTLISRDGTEYQIADSAAPIRSEGGDILGMVLVFNDVTEQYQLREEVTKGKRELQAVMDNSPAVIHVKDINGHFTFINQQFEKLFHLKSEDVIGKTLHDLFPKEIADEMRGNDKAVLVAGHALESEEVAPHDDGLHHYISIKFPLYDDMGDIYAVCGISTDISDRIKQEEQLRHAQKMDALGKLTGGIAHDYNNMLGVVLGYAELLQYELSNQPKLAGYVDEIHHASERGAQLTKKLLAFSRKKSSNSDVEILNINDVLLGMQQMLEKTLTARIKLVFELADDLWSVWLDGGDFEDAIINMVINAMHAIEGNGVLTIRSRNLQITTMDVPLLDLRPGGYVLLSITDTGCGMDLDTKEKIFDPFFSTKGKSGSGLGLSQVYGFVERSDGAIRVYSELGQGTRLNLYFPHYTGGESGACESQAPRAIDAAGGGETLLLVDDEPALLDVTSKILNQRGYHTHCAKSGQQALEILETESVDLLLSDVIMPEMDGYQLAALVQEKHPEVKIQLASGFSDDRHVQMIDGTLHQNLLHKPYSSQALLKRIRELLDGN